MKSEKKRQKKQQHSFFSEGKFSWEWNHLQRWKERKRSISVGPSIPLEKREPQKQPQESKMGSLVASSQKYTFLSYQRNEPTSCQKGISILNQLVLAFSKEIWKKAA